jgi:predicted TIM-barrel fold metal-dependent hydrolase
MSVKMIIDSHMHISTRASWCQEAWESNGLTIPAVDTPVEKVVEWMKSAGIQKAVAMGQDQTRLWDTSLAREEDVFSACEKFPDFFIPFASAEPLDRYNRFNKKGLQRLKTSIEEHKVRGVLFTPPYGQYTSNDKSMYPFYELCENNGIVVQYHHSAQNGAAILAPTGYAQMTYLNEVIIDFPDTDFVVEHLGYPWMEHLFVLMTNNKRIWSDLALTFVRPTWLTWNLVLAKEYGVLDRIMYASDFVSFNYIPFGHNPADDMKGYFEFIRSGLNNVCSKSGWPTFTQTEIDGILGNNAARLYGIK